MTYVNFPIYEKKMYCLTVFNSRDFLIFFNGNYYYIIYHDFMM